MRPHQRLNERFCNTSALQIYLSTNVISQSFIQDAAMLLKIRGELTQIRGELFFFFFPLRSGSFGTLSIECPIILVRDPYHSFSLGEGAWYGIGEADARSSAWWCNLFYVLLFLTSFVIEIYSTPHRRVPGAKMTCVDSINPAGDSRVSHNYASLNDKKYRESTLASNIGSEQLIGNADYLLGVPIGGTYKATIFLVGADLFATCDCNYGKLTSSRSFMAGQIFPWVGDTKSRCCWNWTSVSFVQTSWALVGR